MALFDCPPIYLASNSPRRRELLDQIGIAHTVLAVPTPEGEDEPQLPGEAPMAYVRRTALEKAQRAWAFIHAQGLAVRPILSADTGVIYQHRILGKPDSPETATRMLMTLSGQHHQVLTAVVLCMNGQYYPTESLSQVQFAPLSADTIARYVDSGEPFGKAGAYAIQGLAAQFIPHLQGSYSGVMGLPLFETQQLLQQHLLTEPLCG